MSKILGLYDSGLGGYCVFDYLVKRNDSFNLVLYADQKNAPFGTKSKDDLLIYGKQAMKWFIDQKIRDVVIACNTVSALILEELVAQFPMLNIWGIIDITVQSIPENLESVTVLATQNTCASHCYMKKLNHQSIVEIPLANIAKLIEASASDTEIENEIARELEDYIESDALILGCTHYPLIAKMFRNHHSGLIFDSNEPIYELVSTLDIESKTPTQMVYTTGAKEVMEQQIKAIFKEHRNVEEIKCDL